VKLGDHTVVLEKSVDDWGNADDYGNPARGKVFRELRWCSLTPTRSSEDQSRTSPSISGATLYATKRSAHDVETSNVIISHWTKNEDGTYTGRRWEVIGEVGVWDACIEVQLRRLT
jgi:hypothetical protein